LIFDQLIAEDCYVQLVIFKHDPINRRSG